MTHAITTEPSVLQIEALRPGDDGRERPLVFLQLDLGEDSEAAGYAAGFIAASISEAITDLFGAELIAAGGLPSIPPKLRGALETLKRELDTRF